MISSYNGLLKWGNCTNLYYKWIKREIIDLCKEALSVYSLPKYYEFRDSLPKTLYNKVDYKKLEDEELKKIEEKNKK